MCKRNTLFLECKPSPSPISSSGPSPTLSPSPSLNPNLKLNPFYEGERGFRRGSPDMSLIWMQLPSTNWLYCIALGSNFHNAYTTSLVFLTLYEGHRQRSYMKGSHYVYLTMVYLDKPQKKKYVSGTSRIFSITAMPPVLFAI